MSFSASDWEAMRAALRLAARGVNTAMPNPAVGCVICHDGERVGGGWHQEAGGAHAEIFALTEAGEAAAGATVYVTLEPCCHHGRTPPCADALIAAGVKRLVIACRDPFHKVDGGGVAKLEAAGIQVETGLLADEARWLNRGFFHRCRTGRPWVRLKLAASLDGRTALANGESQWITGSDARADVQRYRARSGAVLTGIGTVLADRPRLDVRLPEQERQPLRVILDSRWRTPPEAPILKPPGRVLIAGLEEHAVAEPLREACGRYGHELLPLPAGAAGLDIDSLLAELGRREINEVHVEAGSRLAGSLIGGGHVDELLVYMAAKIMGDRARAMFAMEEITAMRDLRPWQWRDVSRLGPDLRLTLVEAA